MPHSLLICTLCISKETDTVLKLIYQQTVMTKVGTRHSQTRLTNGYLPTLDMYSAVGYTELTQQNFPQVQMLFGDKTALKFWPSTLDHNRDTFTHKALTVYFKRQLR